jgi:hypothetical protein
MKYTAAQLLYNTLDKLSSFEFQISAPTTTHHSSVTGSTQMSKKLNTLWQNLQPTEATTNKNWITTNYRLQHMIMRMAAQGYHNSCHTEQLHLPREICICRLWRFLLNLVACKQVFLLNHCKMTLVLSIIFLLAMSFYC